MLSGLYSLIAPAFSLLSPETSYGVSMKLLKAGLYRTGNKTHPALEVNLWNRKFPNPLGVAAGFDRNGEVLFGLLASGFGHVEAGTVTPKPREGNRRPRIFREKNSRAFINRTGFPNEGMRAFKDNLEQALSQKPRPAGLIGINIGMNKIQKDPVKDYCILIRTLGPMADYIAVNISLPAASGVRGLQQKDRLLPLLKEIMAERKKSCGSMPPPLLIKISPDLKKERMQEICECAAETGIDGFIVSYTSLERPENLPEEFASQPGGLSGRPIKEISTQAIRMIYEITEGKLPVIGAGGVFSGRDAYEKIRAGASLVQLHSALLYRGPFIARTICEELLMCLEKDGFNNISEATGKYE